MATQDELKRQAAQKAVEYVNENEYLGIGTGSTVYFFIEALAQSKKQIKGAVSTSALTSETLKKFGIPEVTLNEVNGLPLYIDGADEINHLLQMIKGGGGALLNEKIVASAAEKFICIADESKYTSRLGHVSLPVEVTPNARSLVARRLLKLGGEPELRLGFTSDHGNQILDVANLNFDEPIKMEDAINKIPGVVENGLFTHHPADLLVLGCSNGVKVLTARV
ncbi:MULTISPECIES: ribose-5-phosphate isomerase RpiA [unclassified Snodgrassella]|uniref:ribose-5-phosphate isomerase RpiA n=1 Tax=unclassified Snodgrassella TaxID=2625236 RepID=UPI0018DC5A77|nr:MULTISPECIES: ribose-5-phosphate isomerase RpiA [unclassified Snodgrassella]MBI0129833.1 ribose-5-phosphate isomerase RpiA [Snodgrassella sp. W8124]MBI0133304.1 ribose-5-phosphate isomerase RpiA [Snodgrassella sp. W8132]